MIQRTIHIPDGEAPHIVERPDGFYWLDPETGIEFGPFATADEALADMEAAQASAEAEDTLDEAEAELDLSEWVDPDTGESGEDTSFNFED